VLDICYSKELSQDGPLCYHQQEEVTPFDRDWSVYLSTPKRT